MRVLLCSTVFCLLLSNASAQTLLIEYDSAYSDYGYQALYDTTVLAPGDMVPLPVFYDLNKSQIQQRSSVVLDSLAVYLHQHPNLVIEIQGHVDERASNRYSSRLDQRRAQSIVDYLIRKGIAPDHLMAKGYGEDSPIFELVEKRNLTDKEKERLHQLNRRTAMKVLAKQP